MPLALLAALTLLLYGQVGGHRFVDYDVEDYITANPHVRSGLSWENVKWAFTGNRSANWHPLTWLSHMLDCQLWGLRPGPHHLTNVLLHALNGMLLFLVLRSFTNWGSGRTRAFAFVTALLFVVHPLRVESVAWAAERKDVLSGLFFMLSLLAYASYTRRPGLGRYLVCVLGLGAGLLAKPMLVTLPCVLLLLDVWPLGRWPAKGEGSPLRLVLEKLPLFALAAGSSVATYLVQAGAGATEAGAQLSFVARAASSLLGYRFYIWKTLWPSGLACFYPHPALLSEGKMEPLVVPAGIALVLCLAISVLVFLARRSRPYLGVGWLWFLGMLVPVIGLVQVGHQGWADRYSYLPSIGLTLMLVWGGGSFLAALSTRLAWGVAGVLVLASSITTWKQVGVWRESTSLYEHALAVTENNYVMHYNYGRALSREGRLDEAEEQLERAVYQSQGFYGAWLSLGEVLLRKEDPGKARQAFENALVAKPDYTPARRELGLVLARLGETAQAKHELEQVLEADPNDVQAHHTLSILLLGERDLERAELHTRAAIRLRPGFVDALANLGAICAETGRVQEARGYLEQALRRAPDHAEARRNLRLLGGD